MSVALTPWGKSNPSLKPWVVTVLVIIVISWRFAADVVRAFVDVLELVTLRGQGRTAAEYSNRTDRRQPCLTHNT
ncbi:hypothetical protein [Streptomyces sp. SAS_260]|uniref:hypothetical protein n=1 Tax=Streptomyces sp. SAS_260 TaxID=3412751 RepID=UPI00403CA54C